LFFGNTANYTPTSFISETNILKVDPQFNNASTGDFSLKSTSPAIDKGAKTY
jgi:hypothetical protein